MLVAPVLFSGNNYAKIELFADTLGMKFISDTLFSQTQRFYCAPVIGNYWEKTQKIFEVLKDYSELYLCGHRRNDSQGHRGK